MAPRVKSLVDLPGLSVENFNKYPPLSKEKQWELGRRVLEQKDEEARRLLVLHNMRFVVFVARKYAQALWRKARIRRSLTAGFEFSDLVQEGMCGLITAVEKWDYRKGFAFSTYARWWVQVRIADALLETGSVHTPRRDQQIAQQALIQVRRFLQTRGRNPSDIELARLLKTTPERVRTALHFMEISVVSMQEEADRNEIRGDDKRVGDRFLFEEVIPSDRFLAPDIALEGKQELRAAYDRIEKLIEVVNASGKITEKDKKVFLEFYGLDNRTLQKRGFKEIMKRYQISNQRIYQILQAVWRRLGEVRPAFTRSDTLKEFARISQLEDALECVV